MILLMSACIRVGIVIRIIRFVIQRQHLLISLLALEGIVLIFVLLIILYVDLSESYFIFILLTFGACEASLGLACLVSITRIQGNDHISLISILKC